MGYGLIAGLNAGAARDRAPVDPNTFITDGYPAGCDNPLGANSLDENGRLRLKEYYYSTGWVRVADTGRYENDFRLAFKADAPPDGYEWKKSKSSGLRLWPVGKPLSDQVLEIDNPLWIDGVKVQ